MKFSAWMLALAGVMAMGLIGCNSSTSDEGTTGGSTGGGASAKLSGSIEIAGSSTVYPIAGAMTELFEGEQPDVKVTVASTGTGSGMEAFAKGELDIANASRPIKQSEIDALKEAGIEFFEVPVAYDGICIVVNHDNNAIDKITIEELNKVWDKSHEGTIPKWSDMNPAWPAEEIKLYGPTSVHGTYEYFNETVNGDGENVRQDYSQQAEYDTLISGIGSTPNSLGYVGYAYYAQNMDKVKAIPVVTASGQAVLPSVESIGDGSYAPFGRPLMMYVNKKSYDEKPQVKAFVDFLFSQGGKDAVGASGYVVLPDATLDLVKARLEAATVGSVLSGAAAGKSLDQLLSE